ncbi:MAG TPA: hypothetical protein VGJ77_18070 [Gaiellaceae bacterium]
MSSVAEAGQARRPDAPSAREPTLLDRFLAAVPVATLALVVLGFYYWQAWAQKTPWIFNDELEWTQIARSIADTGHAARRGDPIGFKSLYPYLLAPWWWLSSTGTAYAAVKYFNATLMTATAVPVYLLARMLVPQRTALVVALASVCTSAMYYAPVIVPDVAAYPASALAAWLGVRALAFGGRRGWVLAVGAALLGTLVRAQLAASLGALVAAAVLLWLVGPTSRRLRRGWSVLDHVGAALLLVLVLVVANRVLSPHSTAWSSATQHWKGRIFDLGLTAGSALAIGLAVLPAICGLASLWLPERRDDRVYRAFAAYAACAIGAFAAYTAVKAAYLSTIFATLVEERNLVDVAPLLLVGTAVWLHARRPPVWPLAVAAAFVLFLLVRDGYQLGYPYFEAPGYGMAVFANRHLRWDEHAIRIALVVVWALAVGAALLPRVRPRLAVPGVAVAAALVLAWMVAGETQMALGQQVQGKRFVDNLTKPLNWVDRRTGGADVTYLGQNVRDANGIHLLEFWNRSIGQVDSLDGSAPGPGPVTTPDLLRTDGTLRGAGEADYVLADNGVQMVGKLVDAHGDLRLYRVEHPWRLREAPVGAPSGRDSAGWIGTDGGWSYFGPGTHPGTLTVTVDRSGFSGPAPTTTALVQVGPLAIDDAHQPTIGHVRFERRFVVGNGPGNGRTLTFRVAPPFHVRVHVSRTFKPSDYGISDSRDLGAQVTFQFSPTR